MTSLRLLEQLSATEDRRDPVNSKVVLSQPRVLPQRQPDDPLDVVCPWLAVHDRITSGDHALLTGLTQPGALKQLDRLVAEGFLVRGTGRGRNAHFLLGPVLTRDDS